MWQRKYVNWRKHITEEIGWRIIANYMTASIKLPKLAMGLLFLIETSREQLNCCGWGMEEYSDQLTTVFPTCKRDRNTVRHRSFRTTTSSSNNHNNVFSYLLYIYIHLPAIFHRSLTQMIMLVIYFGFREGWMVFHVPIVFSWRGK